MLRSEAALQICVARLLAAPGAPSSVTREGLTDAMVAMGCSEPQARAAFAKAVAAGELRAVPEGWRPVSWANLPRRLGETSAWRYQVARA